MISGAINHRQTAHNGLVAGSSPARPTKEIKDLRYSVEVDGVSRPRNAHETSPLRKFAPRLSAMGRLVFWFITRDEKARSSRGPPDDLAARRTCRLPADRASSWQCFLEQLEAGIKHP
jgi:hypothetical protein